MDEKAYRNQYICYTIHNQAAPPAVNVKVTTFKLLMPQATLQQLTNAGFTIPFAWAIVTVEAAVAPAKEVVKYSVNTFCDGQHGLPHLDT